ncbi:MAG: septum formation initiator family protein [Candidatus Omnitrophica bacterium]|nr:septum formation initiator family protein [Candidatus Omnitrophota bacterium]
MFRNPLWFVTFVVLILAFFLPSYTQLQDLRQKNAEYEHQIVELTKKNVALKEEKRLLKDNPDYLEKVARERMGLVKDNEVIYKFVPPDQLNAVVQANAEKNLNSVKSH